MCAKQSSNTVKFLKPKKSIFSSPKDSQAPISNWVMMAPSCSRFHKGTTSINGSRHKITPAACTPGCLLKPSSPRAVSTIRCASGSALYRFLNSFASLKRSSLLSKIEASDISLPTTGGGMSLVILSETAKG